MEIVIYYNSKTGFTKKYAGWIAEELKCNAFSYKEFTKNIPCENSVVIFGSRIHAGRIEGLNKVKARFSDKRNLIVFATGATPASEAAVIEKMWEANFSSEEINVVPHFYMQSGLNYEKMGFVDRNIMKIVAKLVSGKKNLNETEKGFEQAIKESHDISSKDCITPLLEFVRNKYVDNGAATA